MGPVKSPCRPNIRAKQLSENVVGAVKHKVKAAEKEEQKQAAIVAQASTPSAVTAEPAKVSPTKDAGKKTPKESKKKEKAAAVDNSGNELKRPLSAYMLYNNHRRPTLRAEHPGESNCSKMLNTRVQTWHCPTCQS